MPGKYTVFFRLKNPGCPVLLTPAAGISAFDSPLKSTNQSFSSNLKEFFAKKRRPVLCDRFRIRHLIRNQRLRGQRPRACSLVADREIQPGWQSRKRRRVTGGARREWIPSKKEFCQRPAIYFVKDWGGRFRQVGRRSEPQFLKQVVPIQGRW
jgi:hypothetical protein